MMGTEAGMGAAQNAVVVDLGPLRQRVEDRVKAGHYASADEVIRAGLLALEREERVAYQAGGEVVSRPKAERSGGAGLSGAKGDSSSIDRLISPSQSVVLESARNAFH